MTHGRPLGVYNCSKCLFDWFSSYTESLALSYLRGRVSSPSPSHGTQPTHLTVPASAARSLPHSMQCTVKPMPDESPSWRAASEHLAWYGHTTYRHTTDGHTVYGLTTYRHTTDGHTVYGHTIYAYTTHIHLPILVSTIDNPQTCECINHSCHACLHSCMW